MLMSRSRLRCSSSVPVDTCPHAPFVCTVSARSRGRQEDHRGDGSKAGYAGLHLVSRVWVRKAINARGQGKCRVSDNETAGIPIDAGAQMKAQCTILPYYPRPRRQGTNRGKKSERSPLASKRDNKRPPSSKLPHFLNASARKATP